MTDYTMEQFVGMFRESIEIAEHITEMVGEIDESLERIERARECIDKQYARLGYLRSVFDREYDLMVCEFMQDENEEPEKPCFVYYILNEEKDKVKIGVSNNPMQRAKELQTASGEEIEIINTIEFKNRNEAMKAESFLHREFGMWRKKPSKVSRSCEWFDAEIVEKLMLDYDSKESVERHMKMHYDKMQYNMRCLPITGSHEEREERIREIKKKKREEDEAADRKVAENYKVLNEIARKNPIPQNRLYYKVNEVSELFGITDEFTKALAQVSQSMIFIPPRTTRVDLKILYEYLNKKTATA